MDSFLLKGLHDIIFYYIHEAPRLRKLFIRWSYLEYNERIQIDEIMQTGLKKTQNELYKTLRDALDAWEHLQDTQGAPGFQPGSVQYSCEKTVEDDLTNILSQLENCLDKFYDQKYGITTEISPLSKNDEPLSIIFKYAEPNVCKSDSRLSRPLLRTNNHQRVRTSSVHKRILQTKSCTNLLKLASSMNGYRSD